MRLAVEVVPPKRATLVDRFLWSGSVLQTSPGLLTWGLHNHVTAQGGQYRICWCATTFRDNTTSNASNSTSTISGNRDQGVGYRCTAAEDFVVDVGELVVVGPSPVATQDRTCVAGRECRFNALTGPHLSEDDAIVVLDTCGVGSSPTVSPANSVGRLFAPLASVLMCWFS